MTEAIRLRLPTLPDIRRLSDGEARQILHHGHLTINEPIRWSFRGDTTNPTGAATSVRVFNRANENLRLVGRIPFAVPQCSHWALIWGDKRSRELPAPLRRLDLRDDHVNPDGERWAARTHKHRWSTQDGDAWAYTPTDIPHDATAGYVGADDYRAIFEAFANECGIAPGPDYVWAPPPLAPDVQPRLWKVP